MEKFPIELIMYKTINKDTDKEKDDKENLIVKRREFAATDERAARRKAFELARQRNYWARAINVCYS